MSEEIQEDLKDIIRDNLVRFRKQAKLTQLELAEKLMYSDKNISKWERGESIPEVTVLKQLADLYGISVNDFLVENPSVKASEEKHEKRPHTRVFNKKQTIIILISCALIYLVATILFFVFRESVATLRDDAWKCFIVALALCAVVLTVYSCIWCTNLLSSISVTMLIWTVAVAFFVCVPLNNNWLIFIVAIPVQVLDFLWFTLRRMNKKPNKDDENDSGD